MKLSGPQKQVMADIQANRPISDHSALSSLRKRGVAVMNGDGSFRLTLLGQEIHQEVLRSRQKAGLK